MKTQSLHSLSELPTDFARTGEPGGAAHNGTTTSTHNETPVAPPATTALTGKAPLAPFHRRHPSLLLGLVVLLLVYAGTWLFHAKQPFIVSDSLTHGGAWYRRMALAPWDWMVPSRQYEQRHDWLGRTYVVYHLGSRTFVQAVSNAPAVEILQ